MEMEEEKLRILEEAATARARRIQEEFQGKIDKLKSDIGQLIIKKRTILKGKVSREEAVMAMKQSLRRAKNEWIRPWVLSNLRTFQNQFDPLRDLDHIRTHLLPSNTMIALVLNSIGDLNVDECAPDIDQGLTEAERKKKVDGIDEEIRRKETELEGLLK